MEATIWTEALRCQRVALGDSARQPRGGRGQSPVLIHCFMHRKREKIMRVLPLVILYLALGVQEPLNPPGPGPGPGSQKKQTKCQQRPSKPNPTNPIQTVERDTPLPTEPGLKTNTNKHTIHTESKDQDPTESNESWVNWDFIISAIVTGCTVAILFFTYWMYRISDQQLQLNERFFLIANRPRLRLRSLECEQFERTPKSSIQGLGERFCPEFRALVGIVNVGGTKAIPLHGYLHVRRSRHLSSDWKPAWKSLQCKNIEAREFAGRHQSSREADTLDQMGCVARTRWRPSGSATMTAYCRQWTGF